MTTPLLFALILLLTPIVSPNRRWLAASFGVFVSFGVLIWRDLHRTFEYCHITGADTCDWAAMDAVLWSGWAVLYVLIFLFRILMEGIYYLGSDRSYKNE